MKKTLKFFMTVMLLSVLTVAMSIFAGAAGDKISAFAVDTASAQSALDLGAVRWFQSYDGNYYLFLPTGADRSSLTVRFNATADVMCNGEKLVNGEKTAVFTEGERFVLTCGEASYNLKILAADNTGTVYINTESGNMASVHADKSHKEPGDILILDKDGNEQYNGVLDYIKGRGNSTWLAEKKPYNIKLDEKADLFGMGKHKSWCMLSNPSDNSLIRNSLCYDLARAMGVPFTTDSYNVHLYLNGEYAGLYMITEKVDIGENRIDIHDLEGETEDVNEKDLDEYSLGGKQNSREFGSIKYANIPYNPANISGGYLLETEKIYRYVNEVSGFITDIGQAIVVKTPEYASRAQVTYISNYYQAFEDALYSPTGYNSQGKHYSEYIDVDSLATMYVILEFTANFDGCSSSFYLHKDVGGKLTCGPGWDFDLGLGHAQPNDLINHVPNVADPNLLYVQTCFIGNHAENRKSLLAQAFTHNDFQEKVEQIWAEKFVPYYPTFRAQIETERAELTASAIMNAVRWNNFGTTNLAAIENHYNGQVNIVSAYADARYPVISQAFSNDTYFVKYDVGATGKALVHDTVIYTADSTATVLAAPASNNKNLTFAYWSDSPDGMGNSYAAGDTITVNDNIVLYAQWENKTFIRKLLDSIVSFFERIKELLESIFS